MASDTGGADGIADGGQPSEGDQEPRDPVTPRVPRAGSRATPCGRWTRGRAGQASSSGGAARGGGLRRLALRASTSRRRVARVVRPRARGPVGGVAAGGRGPVPVHASPAPRARPRRRPSGPRAATPRVPRPPARAADRPCSLRRRRRARARARYSGPCLRGSAYSRGLIVQNVPDRWPYQAPPSQAGSNGRLGGLVVGRGPGRGLAGSRRRGRSPPGPGVPGRPRRPRRAVPVPAVGSRGAGPRRPTPASSRSAAPATRPATPVPATDRPATGHRPADRSRPSPSTSRS